MWDYAHSTILEIAVEMGIPVAAMVVMAAWRRCSSSRAPHSDQRAEAAARWLRSPELRSSAICIRSIDFSLQIPGYLVLFGILLGCGLARASAAPPAAVAAVRSFAPA